METTTTMHGRTLRVLLSEAAGRALAHRDRTLLVEMELYFSCLIRKRVNFLDLEEGTPHLGLFPGLAVRFRPVVTRSCGPGEAAREPLLSDFPIVNEMAFLPRWLYIDWQQAWRGEYGLTKGRQRIYSPFRLSPLQRNQTLAGEY